MRILLVEDHDATGRATAQWLRLSGHQVESAGTAADAVELCRHGAFDLLICDIFLPDRDGWSLVRSVLRLCELPAIAVTACCRPGDAGRSYAAGFLAHVTKPFRPEELLSLIRRFGRNRGRRAAPGGVVGCP